MTEVPHRLKFLTEPGIAGGQAEGVVVQRVGIVDGAIGGTERFTSLAALFPQIVFESAGPVWPDRPSSRFDVLIVSVEALSNANVEAAVRRLSERAPSCHVVVVLHDADVMTTRRLIREGAADVLPAPISEPALALSLERLFAREPHIADAAGPSGEVVAFLKAGGGVGATAIAAQLAALVAARGAGKVCAADLDLQFGLMALYLDLPDAVAITDCLGGGQALDETPFATALAAHRSGARILAAPRELAPLETLTSLQVEALITGLRRDFALTLLDLPSVWTAWTSRALYLADRIVLVTQLTVPHIHLVKRQLGMLAMQGLGGQPLTLVCNGLSAEQQASLSLKAAERALGRAFDVLLPEDKRTMNVAINQGLELSAVRRGTKLEKALLELAGKVVTQTGSQARR